MKRIFGLDLVRSIAVIMVLSVHFFLNNGFYDLKINGFFAYLSIFLRWLFYIGVPLFIIITGYLKNNKKLNKEYYKGIRKVVISYFFISLICIIFKKYFLHDSTRLLRLFLGIFNFTTLEYSWYIEMYIGLFLLIPFLNILYKGLKTKKNKQMLIITLIVLVSINPLINYIKIGDTRLEIIPDWWSKIYPLLYYFIGCYINEFKISSSKIKGFIIILFFLLTSSLFSYIYAYNSIFDTSFIGGYGSLQTVIISTLVFMMFYDTKCDKKIINKIFNKISNLSLDIYLFSYMVDIVVYNCLKSMINSTSQWLLFLIPIVLLTFTISFVLAYLKDLLFKLCDKIKNIVYSNVQYKKN